MGGIYKCSLLGAYTLSCLIGSQGVKMGYILLNSGENTKGLYTWKPINTR